MSTTPTPCRSNTSSACGRDAAGCERRGLRAAALREEHDHPQAVLLPLVQQLEIFSPHNLRHLGTHPELVLDLHGVGVTLTRVTAVAPPAGCNRANPRRASLESGWAEEDTSLAGEDRSRAAPLEQWSPVDISSDDVSLAT